VLVGGADIDPASYGATRHPETTGTRPDRDRSEQALLEGAIERDMPVLAICRGMQLLNVCRGGDLEQHLEDPSVAATHKQAPGVFARHDVKVAADSRLGSILGGRALVLSHHHQAPRRLGRDLEAVAWADDGTVEALEDRSRRLLLGILWHPEEGEDRALFEALVDSTRGEPAEGDGMRGRTVLPERRSQEMAR
jgi:putative glutamine amidotransferase